MKDFINMAKPKIILACTVSNSISFVDGMLPDLLGKYRVSILASPGEYWDCIDKYGDRIGRIRIAMERHISPLRDLRSL